MSWLIAAGTLLTNEAANTAPDVEVQMLTSTYNSFTQWFFVYQTLTEIEVLLLAGLFLLYRPYLPFVVSKIWTHLPVVGITNRVRNIAPFGGFSLRNGMYRREWNDNVMYFVKKYLGSYFFMGVAFDIVHIDRGFVQDPTMNKYIATLGEMGYKNVFDMDNAMAFNGIDPAGNQYEREDGSVGNTTLDIVANMGFDSWESARKALNPSGLVNTSKIFAPKFSNIPIDALLEYGADISPGSIAAQVDDIFEYRKPPIEEDRLFKILPWVFLLMAIGLAAAMIISQVR